MLVAQTFATAGMVGLIWFVQVVHYPLFSRVGSEHFSGYEFTHRWLVTFVQAPFMCVEAVSAVWLTFDAPSQIGTGWFVLGLVLLAVPYLSTVVFQIPLHHQLSEEYDPVKLRRLVHTNWIRTIGWTLRGVLVAVMLMVALPG